MSGTLGGQFVPADTQSDNAFEGKPVIAWAWTASRHIEANWRLRCKFVLAALRERSLANELTQVGASSPLGTLISERPSTIGFLLWPYQCAAWNAETRFDRIKAHLNAI